MHPDLEKLQQLDETDRQIARLRAEVTALPRRVAAIETKLAGINAEVERLRKTLKDLEAARRRQEGDIQSLQQKISKYRDQMLAVKTNQEYKALGNEIQFAEQEVHRIEDKILESMLDAEAREKQLKASESEQKKQQAQVEKEKGEARLCTQQDEKILTELLPKREALRASIGADTLRQYDRVLKLRGTAIAQARDQYCQACHVMLRPQAFNDVMAGEELLTCDSCYRFLYFDPANAPVSASASKEALPAAADAADPS